MVSYIKQATPSRARSVMHVQVLQIEIWAPNTRQKPPEKDSEKQ
jgi:hypothetical protein